MPVVSERFETQQLRLLAATSVPIVSELMRKNERRQNVGENYSSLRVNSEYLCEAGSVLDQIISDYFWV